MTYIPIVQIGNHSVRKLSARITEASPSTGSLDYSCYFLDYAHKDDIVTLDSGMVLDYESIVCTTNVAGLATPMTGYSYAHVGISVIYPAVLTTVKDYTKQYFDTGKHNFTWSSALLDGMAC